MRTMLLTLCVTLAGSIARSDTLLLQSTTSTANSGLYDFILPAFREATGITAHVVAVGTGQAIRNAENCDGDVLLVHAKSAEEAFVESGAGLARFDVMYNDFILVGPQDDPSDIKGARTVEEALQRIASDGAFFASRGDDSGTHKKEMSLWAGAGIDPVVASGTWYLETGAGMGATLNTGVGKRAYVLTDRASWITFGNKQDIELVFEGDTALFNQYGVIAVNPARCPKTNAAAAEAFVAWLLSADGQALIAAYAVDDQQLFFPNAAKVD